MTGTPEGFEPGALVLCVDDRDPSVIGIPAGAHFAGWTDEPPQLDGLVRGKVYTVRALGVDWSNDEPVVFLAEIVRPYSDEEGGEPGYYARRFRPLKKLTTESFLTTKVREDA